MLIDEWKRRFIAHFRGGNASDAQWNELAHIALVCSENGDFDPTIGTDEAIEGMPPAHPATPSKD